MFQDDLFNYFCEYYDSANNNYFSYIFTCQSCRWVPFSTIKWVDTCTVTPCHHEFNPRVPNTRVKHNNENNHEYG